MIERATRDERRPPCWVRAWLREECRAWAAGAIILGLLFATRFLTSLL